MAMHSTMSARNMNYIEEFVAYEVIRGVKIPVNIVYDIEIGVEMALKRDI